MPAAMSLNEKTPPRPAFTFVYKHDLSFDYKLPVGGSMKDVKVKVSYPVLQGVQDHMCPVKELESGDMAVVCRGLLCLGLSWGLGALFVKGL